MPNHVTTRCIVSGPIKDIEVFFYGVLKPDSERPFDFDKIIPSPEGIQDVVSGSVANDGEYILTGVNHNQYFLNRETPDEVREKHAKRGTLDEALREGAKRAHFRETTGYPDWYEWNIANWGTKWGSYRFVLVEHSIDTIEFMFETAWSFPVPIFERLVTLFPSLSFLCHTYDEGGFFAGTGYFGQPVNDEPEFDFVDTTPELYELVYGYPPEPDEEEDEEIEYPNT